VLHFIVELGHFIIKYHYINSKYIIFSTDGSTVATINDGDIDTADLWNLTSGNLLQTLEFQSNSQTAPLTLVFSPDGEKVALGIWGYETSERLSIFDVSSGQQINKFYASDDLIPAFSPDSRLVAIGCQNWESHVGWVCLYDITSGNLQRSFQYELSDDYVSSIGYSFDGSKVACGTRWGSIILWDAASGRLLGVFKGHNSNINYLSFSPDGTTLASASADGSVVLWDISPK
jgi:WD40 repeat protein